MGKNIIIAIAIILGTVIINLPANTLAYEIESLSDIKAEKDIVIGPGKIELSLDPGQSAASTIYITNRTGRTVNFKLNVEDFVGSKNADEGTAFLGDQKSPYTLKDYLKPDIWEFALEHGQRIILPVTVSIPNDAEPGGKYGVVFSTAAPPEADRAAQNSGPVVGIASRVGTLFFVKVSGKATENGALKAFSTFGNKKIFEQGPVNFQIIYRNDGNVHLNPYGYIEITNILGKESGHINIDPYFAMPDSERLREAKWSRDFLFGRYTAKLQLNRGYGDIIDAKEFSFWVLPWKMLIAGFAGLVVMVWCFVWVFGRFEFRRK